MNIKAIIFDVDGVLVDTVPYHFEAWRRMFEEQGVKFTFEDYVQKVNGLPRDTGVKNILTDLKDEELVSLADKKQDYFLDAFVQKPPKPLKGVIPFLKHLNKLEIVAVAASSSKNAPFVLDRMGIADYLHSTVSGHDFKNPKPDPEIFLTAAQRAGVEPEYCVVVEDALAGVQAAKNGGMYSVGLLHSQDEQIKKEAHLSIHSLQEYKKIIEFLGI